MTDFQSQDLEANVGDMLNFVPVLPSLVLACSDYDFVTVMQLKSLEGGEPLQGFQ